MSLFTIAVLDALLVIGCCAVSVGMIRRRSGRGPRHGLEERFEHQLLHDDVTKLPGRTLFVDRLERALARAVRRRSACAVLMLDLDRFSVANDGLGPAVGDGLLREVAARLDSCLRPEDTVARVGGDEFAVLVEAAHTPEQAWSVADRIRDALAPVLRVDGHEVFLSASIGIAVGRGGRDRPEDVLQNASVAVQRAKAGGGGRAEVFRQEMAPHPLERLGLETDLRRSLERMDFTLEYQPMVELDGGRVIGAEALVRWRHPERGLLPPDAFVPVAEETGLMLPIGRWVLAHACREAAGWPSGHRLWVNLSARELQQPRVRLSDEVASALADTGLPPESLCLELTERATMEDVEGAVDALRALERLGVSLALDDFGTGYSSLNHLRRFPLELVKIDRSFVAEATLDGEGEAIIHALIDVCHAIGARVVAEGIETAEQAHVLHALGCDMGQGDYYSAALPPEQLRGLFASGRTLNAAAG